MVSVPAMCMELQTSLRGTPWWRYDPGIICDSSILGKTSVVFSFWCEPQEFSQGRWYIWEDYRNQIFLSVSDPATSELSIKEIKRESPWGGKKDSNVGGYSLGISMYHEENHEDMQVRDMEAKWKRVMGTGVCLHITDFLGAVPHTYRYCSLWQCVNTACFGETYSPGPLRWSYLGSVHVWVWNSNVLSSLQNVEEHLDNFNRASEILCWS